MEDVTEWEKAKAEYIAESKRFEDYPPASTDEEEVERLNILYSSWDRLKDITPPSVLELREKIILLEGNSRIGDGNPAFSNDFFKYLLSDLKSLQSKEASTTAN